jgi:hypothetical protein
MLAFPAFLSLEAGMEKNEQLNLSQIPFVR